jgi:hypothetical protein
MNKHVYLRAYLAGIAMPTMFMLIVLTFFIVARFVYNPVAIERLLVFPMAVVPNLWGFWNVLLVVYYLAWKHIVGFFNKVVEVD